MSEYDTPTPEGRWLVASIFAALGFGLCATTINKIPKVSSVQAGYVKPSALEIKMRDLDENGKKETILVYDKIPYLLMEDKNGVPVIRKYELKGKIVSTPMIVYREEGR